MFRTLLLASFAGAGAAYAPGGLVERGNNAQYCSSATKKCSQAKQLNSATAYCSSALPKVTVTRTIRTCKETTTTTTKYTSTFTQGGATPTTVTSTITGCARPTVAPIEIERRIVDRIEDKRAAAQKPQCLPEGQGAISSACRCLSIKPATTTTTSTTITKVNTYTRTVKAVTTVTEAAQATPTKFVFENVDSRFLVSNEEGGFLGQPNLVLKSTESGLNEPSDLDEDLDENNDGVDDLRFNGGPLFFQLNANSGLTSTSTGFDVFGSTGDYRGKIAAVPANAPEDGTGKSIVVGAATQEQITAGSFRPLTCSISQTTDGLCPLECRVRDGDRNQGEGDGYWYVGPDGTLTGPEAGKTYKTYIVTGLQRKASRKRDFGRRGERYARARG